MPQGQRRPPRRRVAGPPPGTWAWGRAFFLGEVAAPQLTAAPRRFTASNVNNVNLSFTPIRSPINVYVDKIESEKGQADANLGFCHRTDSVRFAGVVRLCF